jgi:hypothetical protein
LMVALGLGILAFSIARLVASARRD